MSHTNKHLEFDLDRKLKSWFKFEPNFLTWLPNGKIEKTTVYLLFFLIYSIFSNRNQINLFSRKAYYKFITMAGKKWCARARLWAVAIFQLTELNIKANPPCFQYARERGRAKWRLLLCAERMCDGNVRNHLKTTWA